MANQAETLLIGQSGGATAVINASLAGAVSAAKESGKWGRVLGLSHGIEGLFKREFIDLTDVSHESWQQIARTPSAALGTGRYKLKDDDVARAVHHMQTHNVTAFVYIGGNDSADTAHRIGQYAHNIGYELQVMSVPKTIDNDLPETDFCPGYPSYAKYLANATRDATYDTISSPQLYPVKFVEVMGRNAGWAAAACAVGFSDAEQDLLPILLLPERAPKSTDAVLELVQKDVDRRGFSVVVVPETMRTADDQHFGGSTPEYEDEFGHPYYASTAAAMTRLTTQELGLRARYDKPGTSARMSVSMVSKVDREQAWNLGDVAVQEMIAGRSGLSTVLERVSADPLDFEINTVPQSRIANQYRHMDDVFIGEDGTSITPAFRDYLLPLLGKNPFPVYERLGNATTPAEAANPIPDEEVVVEEVIVTPRGEVLEEEPEIGLDVPEAGDGTATDEHGDMITVRIGQDVLGSCGNKIGEVVDVLEDHMVVEKGFFNPEDVYIPKDVIRELHDQHLVLKLTRDDSEHAGWDEDPAVDEDDESDELIEQ